MRKDSMATAQIFWTVLLTLSMCMLMKQEVHGQWFEHRLQVAGTHGILDLSDELPEKDGSKVHLEINEWNCEFELFLVWNPSVWLRNQVKEKSFRFRSG